MGQASPISQSRTGQALGHELEENKLEENKLDPKGLPNGESERDRVQS